MTMQPGIGDQIGQAAQNAVMSMFGMGADPNALSTQQADQAADRSIGTAQNQSRGETRFLDQMGRDRAKYDADLLLNQSRAQAAQVGNPIANSNTARAIAQNTAATLNNMYAQSGRNLLDSAAQTQQALNSAGATVAGMFR
jgi:hypothetical protein